MCFAVHGFLELSVHPAKRKRDRRSTSTCCRSELLMPYKVSHDQWTSCNVARVLLLSFANARGRVCRLVYHVVMTGPAGTNLRIEHQICSSTTGQLCDRRAENAQEALICYASSQSCLRWASPAGITEVTSTALSRMPFDHQHAPPCEPHQLAGRLGY